MGRHLLAASTAGPAGPPARTPTPRTPSWRARTAGPGPAGPTRAVFIYSAQARPAGPTAAAAAAPAAGLAPPGCRLGPRRSPSRPGLPRRPPDTHRPARPNRGPSPGYQGRRAQLLRAVPAAPRPTPPSGPPPPGLSAPPGRRLFSSCAALLPPPPAAVPLERPAPPSSGPPRPAHRARPGPAQAATASPAETRTLSPAGTRTLSPAGTRTPPTDAGSEEGGWGVGSSGLRASSEGISTGPHVPSPTVLPNLVGLWHLVFLEGILDP